MTSGTTAKVMAQKIKTYFEGLKCPLRNAVRVEGQDMAERDDLLGR